MKSDAGTLEQEAQQGKSPDFSGNFPNRNYKGIDTHTNGTVPTCHRLGTSSKLSWVISLQIYRRISG